MKNRDNKKGIKEITKKVVEVLRREPAYRDSDEKLTACIWYLQMKADGKDLEKLSAIEFMHLYAEKKLVLGDTITRCRRKAQQDHPELRGDTWQARHKNQAKVKKDLGYGYN